MRARSPDDAPAPVLTSGNHQPGGTCSKLSAVVGPWSPARAAEQP